MKSRSASRAPDGADGWDDYAPFYDWENARTLGRRDVPFWTRMAGLVGGPVLELGCGTGRLSIPLAKAGVRLVGVDRSAPMLARAQARVARGRLGARVALIRGDIRHLPFETPLVAPGSKPRSTSRSAVLSRRPGLHDPATFGSGFSMVMAPYGMLQSLLRERDLTATLGEVHRVLAPGGTFGVELVADLPAWQEYSKRVSLKGWRGRAGGAHVTLVETVRQDPKRRLTIFDQEFTERRGSRSLVRRFSLTFRTLSVPQMVRRLTKAGFEITTLLGDYQGGPWDSRAEVWMILAKKLGR